MPRAATALLPQLTLLLLELEAESVAACVDLSEAPAAASCVEDAP